MIEYVLIRLRLPLWYIRVCVYQMMLEITKNNRCQDVWRVDAYTALVHVVYYIMLEEMI